MLRSREIGPKIRKRLLHVCDQSRQNCGCKTSTNVLSITKKYYETCDYFKINTEGMQTFINILLIVYPHIVRRRLASLPFFPADNVFL